MIYPTFEQYNQVFQSHQNFISDNDLKFGNIKKSGLGVPLAISGGFALTYTIENKGTKFAVRCFHKESKGLLQRYTAISQKLKSLNSSFFVNFDFLNNGICVNGNHYPIVKMAWAKGETLGEFLEKNYKNKAALNNLSKKIKELSEFLGKNNISHGDLQMGNIMVSDNGKAIQLIDYDGMYIGSISKLGSSELGHINFQHPLRAVENPFNDKLDNFSFITLWLGLQSLILDASIWDKSQSDSDSLVFKVDDFENPENSKTINLLMSYPQLTIYVTNYIKICLVDQFKKIPTLSDFIDNQINLEYIKLSSPSSFKINTYKSQYPVISVLDFVKCEKYIGSQVEVIGKVTEVKIGWTERKLPYIFLNFNDWRGKAFKVNIWKEGLDALNLNLSTMKPNDIWLGKYISVKGLMEPPYISSKHRYSHLSITITKNDQLTIISHDEFKRRLDCCEFINRINSYTRQQPLVSKNNEIIKNILNNNIDKVGPQNRITISKTSQYSTIKPSTLLSKNQQIAEKIKIQQGGQHNFPGTSKLPTSNHKPKQYQSSFFKDHLWAIVICLIVILFLFRCLF
jgi:hypothetical protein